MLDSGALLGHYEILRPLGVGGMGEVYLARDQKLGRDVAIKVLPAVFLQGADRLARFEREARMLASLNHPNVAHIYGIEESRDLHFLVLEYVNGETLAERLRRGPLPTRESLEVCRQIAEGLEAAHKKGIIHRDLKPANVKITQEGKVKVLDFGLAKVFAEDNPSADVSNSPTVTSAGTKHGVILGTAPYMSPEQARGHPLDTRTDIWSFGCVLYESLSGRVAFNGGTVSDIIAAILQREVDWKALPSDVPPGTYRLLRRCLQKDADQRLQHIGDARIEIQEALKEPEPISRAAVQSKSSRLWMAIAFVSIVLAATAFIWNSSRSHPETSQPISRFEITFPESAPMILGECSSFSISPDGTEVIYAGRRESDSQLYLRSLTSFDSQPIPETQSGLCPFFSPDGKSAGFFTGYSLMRVSLPQGRPQVVLNAVPPPGTIRGASWSSKNDIYFSVMPRNGLMRAPSNKIGLLNLRDPGIGGDSIHRWPEILPGNNYAVTTVVEPNTSTFDEADIALVDLETGMHRILVRGGYDAKYASTGHLVFMRSNTLLAIPFQLSKMEVTGSAVPVLEDVRTNRFSGAADFSFSANGTLIYLPVGAQKNQNRLVWLNRQGEEEGTIITDEREVPFLRLSPTEQRLALNIRGVHTDIWVYDLSRGTSSRLTFGGTNLLPSWTPDGREITFGAGHRFGRNNSTSSAPAGSTILLKPADGSKDAKELIVGDNPVFPGSWSPDGDLFAYVEWNPKTQSDIYLLSRSEPGKPRVFLKTSYQEMEPGFSPDGKWIAYVSEESGQREVYVRSVSGDGPKWKISTAGGFEIRWARNSHELFYREGKKMMAVDMPLGPEFKPGIPHMIFEGDYEMSPSIHAALYDVTPDGQKFLMAKKDSPENTASKLRVVLNWFEELKRLAPSP